MSETGDISSNLNRARRELLDLSARNRLISTPLTSSRTKRLDIVDERSDDLFRILVRERKAMSFLAGKEDDASVPAVVENGAMLGQPEEASSGSSDADPRYTDLHLQTRLPNERLRTRLLDIYYDAQTYEQEQGVSILYLALGFLTWFESPTSDTPRHAPLLLIPVDLDRASASSRFQLRFRDDDVTTNLSLQAKLKAEFGVGLPDVPDLEELSPATYFDAVDKAISDQPRWCVNRDQIVLWFFSFAKFLMYRDLDVKQWPSHCPLEENATLLALLRDGFSSEPAVCGDDDKIDSIISPEVAVHVTDADSSQAVVIEEARRGRHLVVQGPPGTGKSQTIVNIVATSVKAGKRVLFVAEKLAALEVVYRRLEQIGLAPLCLQLHSHKANKKAVLEELARTLNLGKPMQGATSEHVEKLRAACDRLNRHAAVMNTSIDPAGLTPFQVLGRLVGLYATGLHRDFPLSSPESWTKIEFQDKVRRLEDLQTHLAELGTPCFNKWRGVGIHETLLPSDLNAHRSELESLTSSLRAICNSTRELISAMSMPDMEAPTFKDVEQLANLGLRVVRAPELDHEHINNPVWATRRDEIARLVRDGQSMATGEMEISERFADEIWATDVSAVRQCLLAHGHSLLRWFRREYRASVKQLTKLSRNGPPRNNSDRLALLDQIINTQRCIKSFDEDPTNTNLGGNAFGALWRGSKSNWAALKAIVDWDEQCVTSRFGIDHRQLLAEARRPEMCRAPLLALKQHLKSGFERLGLLIKSLALDTRTAFDADQAVSISVQVLLERIGIWRGDLESLSKWVAYQFRRQHLERDGLGAIVAALHEGAIDTASASAHLQVSYYQALIRRMFKDHPELAEFDGRSYSQWIDEFRRLDMARIDLARVEVAQAHYESIPRDSSLGEMAVIRREIEKKRRHKSIRQLIKEAGTAIQAIKPVFMMSPISVAQFLDPGIVTFDLMVIDEASQVSPVDAFGAMIRAKQIVVLGDDKQLPPTSFFAKLLDDDASDGGDADSNPADLQSILHLCRSAGVPQRTLRWHYRSRHHSLIAVSNHEFYEDKLYVVPSPTTVSAATGLVFKFVPDGVFDRGASATNRIEARAIAQAIIAHARSTPQKSLGIGTFSVAQRDVIRDELELLRRAEPTLESFFSKGCADPFFIKNLENIQGDERDVIFISVGYARDESGYMAMNFGPLSNDGGERRLNVLISRAREQCVVFSSITADDIDLQRARSRGAAAFKSFLRYAQTGNLDVHAAAARELDSDFEQQVANSLISFGFDVHHQVGTAGFFLDLAVVDPKRPGRYILGIECDGATYHSSRSARDRDRLREKVLLDRGWRIHRIWSTDWFHRPDEQLKRVHEAIEKAQVEADSDEDSLRESVMNSPSRPIATMATSVATEIERTETAPSTHGQVDWVIPYHEAQLSVPCDTAIHETDVQILCEVISRVVELEGPIHTEEVARRLTSLWGLQRTGNRIVEATNRAIECLLRARKLQAESHFLDVPGRSPTRVRSRESVSSSSLRKPETIPPAELRQAIRYLVNAHVGISGEELATNVIRAFGFKATSEKLRACVDETLNQLLTAKEVQERDQKLYPLDSQVTVS